MLAVLVLLLLWYYFFPNRALIPAALLFLFVTLLVPAAARGVHFVWQRITRAVGAVSGKILLSAVFLLVLTPLAWAFRLVSRRKFQGSRDAATQFVTRNHTYQPKDLEQLYSAADNPV
ncbi:MAG TPA: hypothetical protein PKE06_13975 [Flavilitoribacter sp.]|nr:hypothetical protein [Flavilitoribacter sp.]HMQ89941.1 hypothetical protein [Flavilitoribacter sp.]